MFCRLYLNRECPRCKYRTRSVKYKTSFKLDVSSHCIGCHMEVTWKSPKYIGSTHPTAGVRWGEVILTSLKSLPVRAARCLTLRCAPRETFWPRPNMLLTHVIKTILSSQSVRGTVQLVSLCDGLAVGSSLLPQIHARQETCQWWFSKQPPSH
jgi:hypothetical protein